MIGISGVRNEDNGAGKNTKLDTTQ